MDWFSYRTADNSEEQFRLEIVLEKNRNIKKPNMNVIQITKLGPKVIRVTKRQLLDESLISMEHNE